MTASPRDMLAGILPATVTPFREDHSFDASALTNLVRSLLEVGGITGIVVNGVAGEVGAITDKEQGDVIKVAVEATEGRVPVIAGLTAETARGAAALTELAARNGAAAALVQAPAIFGRGVGLAPEIAVEYFREVGTVGLPIILFQHQIQAGRAYALPLLLRLLEIPGLVAVKETVWEVEQYEREVRAIRKHRPETRILCANDTLLLPCLALGHHDALLLGFASMIPKLIVELYERVLNGDLKGAQAVNDRIAPVTACIYASPPINYYARMKAAMKIMGSIPNAIVRPPLQASPQAEVELIRDALVQANLC